MADRSPTIRALKFWVSYDNDPANPDEKKANEWVQWVKVGTSNAATTSEKIARLKANPERKRPAALEWPMLEEAYDAWKKGEEPPLHGTPLAAWPGCTPALIEACKGFGVKTVEDFKGMPDHEMTKIKLPNIRHMWETAGEFLKAREGTKLIEAALAERDAEMDELKRQIAVLTEKRGPGRPRKEAA